MELTTRTSNRTIKMSTCKCKWFAICICTLEVRNGNTKSKYESTLRTLEIHQHRPTTVGNEHWPLGLPLPNRTTVETTHRFPFKHGSQKGTSIDMRLPLVNNCVQQHIETHMQQQQKWNVAPTRISLDMLNARHNSANWAWRLQRWNRFLSQHQLTPLPKT